MAKTIKRKLGVGVIGCGMGEVHMCGIDECNEAELKAVCDTDVTRLERAARLHMVQDADCYSKYEEMIKRPDIDIIVVATPDQLHPEQTIASLRAGKHVLCEKPMAMSIEACKMMIDAAGVTGKKLMVGQIGRYAPGFVQAKEFIKNGLIGELFYVESEYAHDYSQSPGIGNWRTDNVRLRQPVLGGGCHCVDLLRWLAGDPYEVCAFANRKVLKTWPVDDCTVAILRFPQEVIGKVMISIGCKRNYTMKSVFYGDKGTIIADNTSNHIKVYKNNISREEQLFENGAPDQVIGMEYPVNISSHNTYAEINEFVDIVKNDKPVVTDGYQGLYTVAACLAIIEAAAKGEKIIIDYNF